MRGEGGGGCEGSVMGGVEESVKGRSGESVRRGGGGECNGEGRSAEGREYIQYVNCLF